MVDLIADDPLVGIRGAAMIAAKAIKGIRPLSANAERLRKKYRKLLKRGQLPQGGDAGRTARTVNRIRELFRLNDEYTEEKNRELALKEAEAEAAGVDISQENLVGVLRGFEKSLEALAVLVEMPIESALGIMRVEGIRDSDAAVARYIEATTDYAALKVKIEYLRELSRMRRAAGRPF